MATWVVGDIHGCSHELALLIEALALSADDALVCVGDLFHRGPDPIGVVRLLREHRARFVLGNHEHVVLRRLGLAPSVDCTASARAIPAALEAHDLDGDGRQPCIAEPSDRAAIVRFLQSHSGFRLRNTDIAHAGATRDGRGWVVVHAGVLPDVAPERCSIDVLTGVRRLESRGRPWWYEGYVGPDLVLFGHTPSKLPRVQRARGKIVAMGLDTGCVYGGRLTAYSPELDELRSVAAVREYARA